ADNIPVVLFNLDDVSAEQVASLQTQLIDETLDEESGFYQVEDDPVSDEASIIAAQTTDINGWQVIGSFPESEIPSRNAFESTSSLFDVSEIGDTISIIVERAVNFLN